MTNENNKLTAFQTIAAEHGALIDQAQAYLDALRRAIASGDLGCPAQEFLPPTLADVAGSIERRIVSPMRSVA